MAVDNYSLAFLSAINREGTPLLRSGNTLFECHSYGILSLNELMKREEISTSCREELLKYEKQNPLDLNYVFRHLRIEQKYHYEFIQNECILYSSGQVSFAEKLLQKGFAVMLPLFKDDIWFYRHSTAQKFAKIEKRGIWKNNLVSLCIAELYKE